MKFSSIFLILLTTFLLFGCTGNNFIPTQTPNTSDAVNSIPHQEAWGIYELDLNTEEVKLLYNSPNPLSSLQIDASGTKFAFSQKFGGDNNENEEICTININGSNFKRLTNNSILDTYPSWSSDGSKLIFLSWRNETLDIYLIDADGTNTVLLYDSGFHDADIHWQNNKIAFTRNSQIWIMDFDGTNVHQITNTSNAGEWGNANLPFGDYDPRLSPDGSKILFERLIADDSPHGNYDLYVINIDGSDEIRLTNTGYSQGLASWSNSGDRIVYVVAAINKQGEYKLYLMDADGSNNHKITPDYFPSDFLCHSGVFSKDDSKIYFIGQWWN